MNNPILENPNVSSTEAANEKPVPEKPAEEDAPPFVSALFPLQPAEAGLSHCPEILRGIVGDIVKQCGARPEHVTAVALCVAAVAMGQAQKINHLRGPASPAFFNLVLSHNAPGSLPWFDLLASPLVDRVMKMQVVLYDKGQAAKERQVAQAVLGFQDAARTIHAEKDLMRIAEADVARKRAGLKPFVIMGRFDIQMLSEALPLAFDNCVTFMALGSDPGDQLLRLKADQRSRLAEILNRSLKGTPLTIGRKTHAAHVSLLWQTAQPTSAIVGAGGFDPRFLAVPMLLLSENAAKPITQLSKLPHEAAWSKTLEVLFDLRCKEKVGIFPLSKEAEAALSEFGGQIESNLEVIPEKCRPHVNWLPELARRVTLLFWILNCGKEVVVDVKTAADAIAVVKWIGRQHLRAVASAAAAVFTDHTDWMSVMLTKIEAKAPISRRELWRSFDNPRVKWFSPALESLISSGRVRRNDRKELVPA